ncbi:hypothetical protein BDN72DRAFT_121079 [Pluteus cervinus]|uniref:Uncharacterized protein n=1 Tax=Pluteus cervinus TaxID=181527 RepID=A0ACD3B7B8_9AGAR|nr:hypothetical protein BDN72DRAFT_121079 [Pluteus cervinus]
MAELKKSSNSLECRIITPYQFVRTEEGWIVTSPKTDELTAQMQAATMDDPVASNVHEISLPQSPPAVELPPNDIFESAAPTAESILSMDILSMPVDEPIPDPVYAPAPLPPTLPPSPPPPPPQSPRAEIRRDRVAKSSRPYPRTTKISTAKNNKLRSDSETSSDSEYDAERDRQAEERALGPNVLASMTKRTFPCTFPGCNDSFTRRGDLARHLKESKKHAAARVWHCPRCGKEFHRKDALKRHGEKRKPCKPKVQKPQRGGDALLMPVNLGGA